ncbi:MAG: ATP-binding protein [Rhodocyclaceae bacterium]
MIAQRLRSTLSLRFQLLLAVAVVLLALGSAAIVASGLKETREYRKAIAVDVGATLDALENELAGAAVIADYATIEQILKARAGRELIDEIVWQDARGNVLRAHNVNAVAERPAWFAAWVALALPTATRPLQVGGVSYGRIEVRSNAIPIENRLWQSLWLGAAILAGMLLAVFGVIAFLLQRGLKPLGRLTAAAARIGAGDFSVRVADAAGDPPEMRSVLAAFNRMAADVATLIDDLARVEESLRHSHNALEEKVLVRTADLSALNAVLTGEKAQQQALIKRLEAADHQLRQAEKMASIGQLAAGVAHEINNPIGFVNSNLNVLRGYVDELLGLLAVYERHQGLLPGEVRRTLEQHKAEVDLAYLRADIPQLLSESAEGLQRVKRIVDDLKDFSRIDQAEWQLANLERGLESTLRVVWHEIKYKAEVVKEFGGIPEIECLAGQLNQVFANLLVNAAQSMEGPGRITLRTGTDGADVWVEVADTGKGISPEHLPRIFDPFFTTKPVGEGTGLGLSLSFGIVKKHGGRIEVSSEAGRGTTFRVILPMQAPTRSGVAASIEQ